ncbi:inositol monophosphatase, putative [Babesia ovis]|uniref:Inositol monophosphatase, putative n=1 Tax=Babesia ovis TaxID=5869 RepID=A0A9W5WW78_BABOV|nr:inositol monophosphatase, putative [Babesia ovis]
MKFNTTSTFKGLVNSLGNINRLKPSTRTNLLDAYKITPLNKKHAHVALYAGDWTKINCDCIHFHDEGTLRRQLVLARIAKYDPELKEVSEQSMSGDSNPEEQFKILRINNYMPHIRLVSYGNLVGIGNALALQQLKSLLVPLETSGKSDYDSLVLMMQYAKQLGMLERVILCTEDNNTWSILNKLLMS